MSRRRGSASSGAATTPIPFEPIEQTIEWWRAFWGHCSVCGQAGHKPQECPLRQKSVAT